MKRKGLLDIDKNLTFGIEIEYINASQNTIIKYLNEVSPIVAKNFYDKWTYSTDPKFCKYNKSDVFGGEVKSAVLKNKRKHLKNLEYVLESMKTANASVDGRTGLHYHVSADVFQKNKDYILRFLKLYLAYEHIIYKFGYNGSSPRSVLLDYASPIKSIFINKIEESKKLELAFDEIVFILNSYIPYKKHGINFNNISNSLNTVEFRMCNGSLDYETILNEIELFCNLMLSCRKELDEELIEYKLDLERKNVKKLTDYSKINMEDAINFSNMVFNSEEAKDRFIRQYKKIT